MRNRLLIGLVFVAIFTGMNVYANRERYSGLTTFNNYGFSFKYPSNAQIFEFGHPDYGSAPSDFSGRVATTVIDGEEFLEQTLIVWTVMTDREENDMTMREGLFSILDDITRDSQIVMSYISEINEVQVNGYNYTYVYFDGEQMRSTLSSVIGLNLVYWDSLRTERAYILAYATPGGVYSEETLVSKYLDFVETFNPDAGSP